MESKYYTTESKIAEDKGPVKIMLLWDQGNGKMRTMTLKSEDVVIELITKSIEVDGPGDIFITPIDIIQGVKLIANIHMDENGKYGRMTEEEIPEF